MMQVVTDMDCGLHAFPACAEKAAETGAVTYR